MLKITCDVKTISSKIERLQLFQKWAFYFYTGVSLEFCLNFYGLVKAVKLKLIFKKYRRFEVEGEPPEYFFLLETRRSSALIFLSTLARWIDAIPSAKLSKFINLLFMPLNLPSFLLNYDNRLCKLMTQCTLANLFLLRSLPWMAIF